MPIYQVALPLPKRQLFDYLHEQQNLHPGCRVRVPFGPRELIGVVMSTTQNSPFMSKLKPISQVIDEQPIIDSTMLSLCNWLAGYYHHPIGEVLHTVMPVALRKGESDKPKPIETLRLTQTEPDVIPEVLGRAKKQRELYAELLNHAQTLSVVKQKYTDGVIKGLLEKNLATIELVEDTRIDADFQFNSNVIKPKPNVEQALAITAISQALNKYTCFLLEGITGSGKTEVYLQSIEEVLRNRKQVLILVPEIGLTPQTVKRFENRFGLEVGILHSNLTDNERLLVWQKSRAGKLSIIIGTRSSIFTPMVRPGMIIVDEEHDASYKQQDGLKYSARDLAVIRAKEHNIPLLLGSATPSLESLNNALTHKYQLLQLNQRAGNAVQAKQSVLDITNQPLQAGLAAGMLTRIEQHLKAGNQVMLFVNRRGFAPALLCHQCGHVEECKRCNKPFTVHKSLQKIQCHHCGAARALPKQCKECGHHELITQGVGTEQLSMFLQSQFPQYSAVRIDSDSVRGKAKLDNLLTEINAGAHQILIGTQILSKGHHFPNVTLVVILDADGALFSADFRASEHLAQLITQLSGRAGRAQKLGEMWLQTHQPGHPLLQDLINNGYGHFARFALSERKLASLPPFSFHALFRTESLQAQDGFEFLSHVSQMLQHPQIRIVGPIPAIMEKRQGKYRMQLLLQSHSRAILNQVIGHFSTDIEALPIARKVRWSIDIDPQDFI
ncbi:primosomal protein N' [Aliiglaciecola lipolytica]|uniref:Replication restart protein PriA n=1 Tax=Aliiglaciecola lipolytica E3 TaxID=1127673 RepID=K6YJ90_9ALTE|nr:primosomal protein N' [Aliiglaciecola lipolytica]GAC16678.1 primosomal protein N' [Aliiglaciecola lipolytica E3]